MYAAGVSSRKSLRLQKAMEDAYCLENDLAVSGDGFFGVFDGHGGDSCSKWSAIHLPMIFKKLMNSECGAMFDTDAILFETFRSSNSKLYDMYQDSIDYTGTTASVCYIDPANGVLYTANVGDSKIVFHIDKEIMILSDNHSASEIGEITRIKDSSGQIFNERVGGVLSVSRALGDRALKSHVIWKPYTTRQKISDCDNSFLIIATDGLWDVVGAEEAVRLIETETDPKSASRTLLKRALKKKSIDDVTVIVVRFDFTAQKPEA